MTQRRVYPRRVQKGFQDVEAPLDLLTQTVGHVSSRHADSYIATCPVVFDCLVRQQSIATMEQCRFNGLTMAHV